MYLTAAYSYFIFTPSTLGLAVAVRAGQSILQAPDENQGLF
jgi:hypothetical protein